MCFGPIYQSRAPLLQVPKIASRSTWQVGCQLAMIGDDINDRYEPRFSHKINMLATTPDTASEAFANVMRELFRDGTTSLGPVVPFLCFGCRTAANTLQRGIQSSFYKIIGFLCRFIIAKWVTEHGGWSAVLNYLPQTVGWPTIGLVSGITGVSILTAYYLRRR